MSRLLSGGGSQHSAFRLGRTAEEFTVAVAGAAGQWADDAAAAMRFFAPNLQRFSSTRIMALAPRL